MGSHNGGPFFFVQFGLFKKTKLFIFKQTINLNLGDYIKANYDTLYQAAKNITKGHQLTDDLFQHCIEVILTDKNEEKIQSLIDKNQMQYYFVSILIRNYHSSTSRFHYEYRKIDDYRADKDVYEVEIQDDEFDADREAKISFIEGQLDKLDWYDRQMAKLYFEENMSYQKIAEFTKIPKTSCYNSITQIKNKIKNNYNGSN
jgi:RNA polymerase sigma factor (sigma-70 family)